MTEFANMDAIIQLTRADGATWNYESGLPVPNYMMVIDITNMILKQGDGITHYDYLEPLITFANLDEVNAFYDTYFDKIADFSNTSGKLLVVNSIGTKVNFADYSVDELLTTLTMNTRLSSVANITHTHGVIDITDAGTAATRHIGLSAGQIPTIGSTGKLPTTSFDVNTTLDHNNSDVLSFLLTSRLAKDSSDTLNLPFGLVDEFNDFTGVDPLTSIDYEERDGYLKLPNYNTQNTLSTLTAVPADLLNFSMCNINNKVYIFGGVIGVTQQNTLYVYDITTDTWETKTTTEELRTDHTAVTYDGKMYIYGGYNSTSGILNDLRCYNPTTNLWSAISSNVAVYKHGAIVHNGYLYIIGGTNSGFKTYFYRYSFADNIWVTTLAQLPVACSTLNYSVVLHNNGIYIVGGYTAIGQCDFMLQYDIVNNTWVSIDIPFSIVYNTAVVVTNKMYVFGGVIDEVASTTIKVYDFVDNTWTDVGIIDGTNYKYCGMYISGKIYLFGSIYAFSFNPFHAAIENIFGTTTPTARQQYASCIVGSKIYIHGGYNDGTYYNAMLVYDTSTGIWTTLATGPSVRKSHRMIHYNGSIYLFGGSTTTYLNDVWKYTIASNTWSQLSNMSFTLSDAAIAISGTKIYLFGGRNGQNYLNQLWSYNILTSTWTELATGPTIRGYAAMIAYGDKLYMCGGYNGVEVLSDMWAYTVADDKWEYLGDASSKLYYASINIYRDIFIISNGIEHGDILTYDPIGDTWDTIDSKFNITRYCDAHLYNDNLYSLLGSDLSNATTNFSYAVDLRKIYDGVISTSTALTTTSVPEATRFFMRASADGGAILNVDLIAEISRNDGADWVPVILKKLPMVSSLVDCYAGNADLSLSAFSDVYNVSTATLEDTKGDITTFITDALNVSGHFDSAINTRILVGSVIVTADGEVIITEIEGDGTLPNQIKFNGTLAVGNHVIESIHGTTADTSLKLATKTIEWNAWSRAVDVPTSPGAAIACIGDNVYVYDNVTVGSTTNSRLQIYNIPNGTVITRLAPNIPSARDSCVCVVYDEKMYIHGGRFDSTTEYNELWCYDPVKNLWSQLATPTMGVRYLHVGTVVGTKLYIYGGKSYSSGTANYLDLWEYNFLTNVWTQKANGTQYSQGSVGFTYNNNFYIHGGYYGVRNRFDIYNPVANTWSTQVINGPEVYYHAGVCVGDYYYLHGGNDGTGWLSGFWRFDLVNAEWLQLPDFPTAYNKTTMVEYNGAYYVFDDGLYTYTNRTYKFEFTKEVPITHIDNMTFPSIDFPLPDFTKQGRPGSVCQVGNIIYICGWYDDANDVETADVFSYDMTTNTVTVLTSMSVGRYGAAAAHIGGTIYVFGGRSISTGSVNSMEAYNIAGNTWSTISVPFTIDCQYATAIVISDKLYIFGGRTASTLLTIGRCYDLNTDTWTSFATPVAFKRCPSVTYYNGLIYIYGGGDYSLGTQLKLLYSYNPTTTIWTQLVNGYKELYGHGAVVYQDELYVFGGIDNTLTNNTSIYKYNFNQNKWYNVADDSCYVAFGFYGLYGSKFVYGTGMSAKTGAYTTEVGYVDLLKTVWAQLTPVGATLNVASGRAVVYVGTNVYIHGGNDYQVDSFFYYDTVTNTLVSLPNTIIRAEHSVVHINNVLYFYGGKITSDTTTTVGSIYSYNLSTNTWSQLTSGIVSAGHRSVVYNGKMYVYGGVAADSNSIDILRVYDPAEDTWTTIGTGPVAVGYFHMAIVSGVIYIHGGWNSAISSVGLNGLYTYNIPEDEWESVSDGPVLHDGQAIMYGHYILIFGGKDSTMVNISTINVYNIVTEEWYVVGNIPFAELVDIILTEDMSIYLISSHIYTTGSNYDYTPTHYSAILDVNPSDYKEIYYTKILQQDNGGKVAYSFRYDDNTFDIYNGGSWVTIVKLDGTIWKYFDIDDDVWRDALINTAATALSQAHEHNLIDYITSDDLSVLSGLQIGKTLTGIGITLSSQVDSPVVNSLTIKGILDLGESAPSGTKLRWRVRTSGEAACELHGLRVKWSE